MAALFLVCVASTLSSEEEEDVCEERARWCVIAAAAIFRWRFAYAKTNANREEFLPDTNTNADDGARPLFSDGSNGGSPGKGRGDTQRSDGSFHHVHVGAKNLVFIIVVCCRSSSLLIVIPFRSFFIAL